MVKHDAVSRCYGAYRCLCDRSQQNAVQVAAAAVVQGVIVSPALSMEDPRRQRCAAEMSMLHANAAA